MRWTDPGVRKVSLYFRKLLVNFVKGMEIRGYICICNRQMVAMATWARLVILIMRPVSQKRSLLRKQCRDLVPGAIGLGEKGG